MPRRQPSSALACLMAFMDHACLFACLISLGECTCIEEVRNWSRWKMRGLCYQHSQGLTPRCRCCAFNSHLMTCQFVSDPSYAYGLLCHLRYCCEQVMLVKGEWHSECQVQLYDVRIHPDSINQLIVIWYPLASRVPVGFYGSGACLGLGSPV